ncbi:hypothetical protein J7337_010271 [Fusarium musae]|uniref:Phosphatidylinositol-specific phospholipase C X domain-containing protein n=1 Tax=Fusarium musae TaxID=1042133 RepID=A0A9P8D8N6_9HYPO|nr:hypothetical protein J7337_010271 [Fusarium musae]KAG9497410.1 hypothetical protein J7337_010271 [Fusarium musae]
MEVPTAIPTPVPPVTFRPPFFHWHSPFIELRFKESLIKFDIGRSSCKVSGLDGPSGQAMSIISPTVPKDSDGSDFNLSVFAGPEKLKTTLDSIIQANKDSIIESLKQQYSQLKDIRADCLECSFAAVSKQGHNASWNMDIILNFSGAIHCDPHSWVPKLNVEVVAYKFDRIISPILEKGVDKLCNLRTGTAPSTHRLDDTENIYIGQQAYDDLIDHITLLSQAHDKSKTLKRQLEDGIRFLDLCIYREDDGEYYNQHFLRGPKLDELLDQIGQFLEKHSSSEEFIIVELAQCYSLREHVTEVAKKVNSRLARWLYMPSDAEAHPGRYDFQTLHDKPLSSITEGKPKVLFVSREGACTFPHSILNVEDKSLENPANGSPLFPRWFTKVPTNGEEVAHILLNTFDPDARIKNLRHRAYERNAEVSQVLGQKDTPWRYMMDWYTDCKGVEKSEDLPVERIIQANK